MSNNPPSRIDVTNSRFTYVNGNQTNYNYGYPGHGFPRFDHTAENPDPQTWPQGGTGRNTHPEPSQAPPPPPSFAAYSQAPQQYPFQYQPNHGNQWNPPPMPFTPNVPIDPSGNPLLAQPPTANEPSHRWLQTPAQSPLSPQLTSGSNVVNTPQPLSRNPPLTSSNSSQATPPTQTRGQSGHRRSDRGPVSSKSKH